MILERGNALRLLLLKKPRHYSSVDGLKHWLELIEL